jgi:hypothetical protein
MRTEERLKICVLTQQLTENDNKPIGYYLSQIESALKVASEHGASLLALPANTIGKGNPPPNQIPQITSDIQAMVDSTSISIIAELAEKDTRYFSPNSPVSNKMIQRFVDSEAANKNKEQVAQVLEDFKSGNRIITLDNKRIGILLCGENNILRNVDHDNPVPRYSDIEWFWDYEVLINPAHTIMGEPHLIQKRLEYFSQGNRTAIHCTNDTTLSNKAKRAIYIYQDGKLIANGDLENYKHLPVHIEKTWRAVTVEVM